VVKEKIVEDYGNDNYSGILQLRCKNKEKLDVVMGYIKKGQGLCKVVLAKNGYDIFVGPRGVMNKLIKALPLTFGGKLSYTTQLVTIRRQTSKEVYRYYVLYWIFPYSKGEIIVIDNSPIRITGISKKITGNNLATGKRITFIYDKEDFEKLVVHKVRASKYSPKLTLLHPETFQETIPVNEALKKQEEYDVVALKEKVYIVNQ